jgi:eukaryotic-like serine/threonine-protein kinase
MRGEPSVPPEVPAAGSAAFPAGPPGAGSAGADRLEFGELLGRGALTDVYRGHDRLLDRDVAVKVFRPHADNPARLRFEAEACALARLSHPGLVSIFNIGEQDGRPYLVVQLIPGDSLATRLQSGPLPLDTAVHTATVLADALAHAHERGVVHRDVKPSNILLDADGDPHLTDFGIALLAGAERFTHTDEIIGTPAYLAPEQVLGTEIGPAADVFSLGLVILESLTGELEYAGPSRLEAALARLHRAPRIPTDLPPALAALLTAMTARHPPPPPPPAPHNPRSRTPSSFQPRWWATSWKTVRAIWDLSASGLQAKSRSRVSW